MEKLGLSIILACMFLTVPFTSVTQAKSDEELVNIAEENTFQHAELEQNEIKTSKHVKELLQESEIKIENSKLIQLLNESSWRTSPFAFGYNASISLGRWPLHYTSEDSSIYPQFQTVNINEKENNDSGKAVNIYYHQLEKKRVNGALTEKVDHADQIKEMILQKAAQQHDFPLAFQATIGKDTKLSETYPVPPSQKGILKAHIPAIKESGYLTMGEITLKMKGSETELVVKNVTEQEVGAFIPIRNQLSFTFESE